VCALVATAATVSDTQAIIAFPDTLSFEDRYRIHTFSEVGMLMSESYTSNEGVRMIYTMLSAKYLAMYIVCTPPVIKQIKPNKQLMRYHQRIALGNITNFEQK